VETVIDKHAEDMHKAKEFSERIVAGLAEWAVLRASFRVEPVFHVRYIRQRPALRNPQHFGPGTPLIPH
jgi:hypothetical protein